MGFFRKGEDELDSRLRDARPEPPAELVSELARNLQSAPARRSPRLRLGIAAGLTSALLVAFASVGGVGYAAVAASKAATAVSKASGSDSKKSSASDSKASAKSSKASAKANLQQNNHDPHPDPHHPSAHQYGHGHLTICHHGRRTLVLPIAAAQAHLAHHRRDTLGPCPH